MRLDLDRAEAALDNTPVPEVPEELEEPLEEPEEPEEAPAPEEDCPPCKLDSAAGFIGGACARIRDANAELRVKIPDCKELLADYEAGKINVAELRDRVLKHVKGTKFEAPFTRMCDQMSQVDPRIFTLTVDEIAALRKENPHAT